MAGKTKEKKIFYDAKYVKKKFGFLKITHRSTPLSERSCREWFQKFKSGEFDIEHKERSGRPKVYEDAELEALLDQDSCQTQEEQYDGKYFE